MPTLPTEQIAAVPAANLDILFDLTNTILSTFQKVVELELQTMKSDLTETDEPTRMAFSANDPQQLLAVSESVDLLQRTGWASRPSQIDVNSTISPLPCKLNSRRSPMHNTKRTSARCKTSSTASRTALRLVRGPPCPPGNRRWPRRPPYTKSDPRLALASEQLALVH